MIVQREGSVCLITLCDSKKVCIVHQLSVETEKIL